MNPLISPLAQSESISRKRKLSILGTRDVSSTDVSSPVWSRISSKEHILMYNSRKCEWICNGSTFWPNVFFAFAVPLLQVPFLVCRVCAWCRISTSTFTKPCWAWRLAESAAPCPRTLTGWRWWRTSVTLPRAWSRSFEERRQGTSFLQELLLRPPLRGLFFCQTVD